MAMKLELSHIQKLNMTESLINGIKLLELNSVELEDYIKEKSEENVLLEYVEGDFHDYSYRMQSEELDLLDFYRKDESFTDYLKDQLMYIRASEKEKIIMNYIIDNLDESGFYKDDISETAEILKVSEDCAIKGLENVKSLEPCGVGAFNVTECLEIQAGDDNVLRILIKNYLEDIANSSFLKIQKELNITETELMEKIKKLKKLNPIPSAGFKGKDNSSYILPDIKIETENGIISVSYREDNFNRLYLNNDYLKLLDNEKTDDETKKYLEEKKSEAQYIINIVNKRIVTLKKVTDEIIRRQSGFFVKSMYLEKLSLQDVAEEVNLSVSTVSRCVKNKYVLCERGLFPLSHFFQKGLAKGDYTVSRDYVISKIKKLVSREDRNKPLSDEKITEILREKGIDISRRTVNKYRKMANIPPSDKRKNGAY